MAINQPYVLQRQDKQAGGNDLAAGIQLGSQLQLLSQQIENQRMNDVRSMESVIKEWQDSGMFHQKIHEQPDFFLNYLSKVTRIQDPTQLKTMYNQYATGLRTWQEQLTTTQAEVGELATRGQPPAPQETPPTPTPTTTPEETPMTPLNVGLKGDLTRTERSTTGSMDYPTFLDEAAKRVTQSGVQLDPTEARDFFVGDENKKSLNINLADIYRISKARGKDPEAVLNWLFQDANWNERARVLDDMTMTRVAENEGKYKGYDQPFMAPTYKHDEKLRKDFASFRDIPAAPGPQTVERTINIKDQNLGAVKNGIFTPTPDAAKVRGDDIVRQLGESLWSTGKDKSTTEAAKDMQTFKLTLWGRNKDRWMQKHPEFKDEEMAKRAFLGELPRGGPPAWQEAGFDLEVTTPVDLSATEIATADPKVPKAVTKQFEKIEPQIVNDVDKLAELPPEELASSLINMQQENQHGDYQIMDYDEATANLRRLDRNASFLADIIRRSPSTYAAFKKNLERVADLSGGIGALLGKSGLGNSAQDLMGMAAYMNAQANWQEAASKIDPNSPKNQIEAGKLKVEQMRLEKELRDIAAGTSSNDAFSKEATMYLKAFNDIAAKVTLKNPDYKIGDVLKSNAAAQATFRQYMFTLYRARPENRGKSQAELASTFNSALVKIQTDKNWDNYEMFVLPEVANLVQRSPEGGIPQGGMTPQANTPSPAPQRQKMDPEQRNRINQGRLAIGLPPVNEYGE